MFLAIFNLSFLNTQNILIVVNAIKLGDLFLLNRFADSGGDMSDIVIKTCVVFDSASTVYALNGDSVNVYLLARSCHQVQMAV